MSFTTSFSRKLALEFLDNKHPEIDHNQFLLNEENEIKIYMNQQFIQLDILFATSHDEYIDMDKYNKIKNRILNKIDRIHFAKGMIGLENFFDKLESECIF